MLRGGEYRCLPVFLYRCTGPRLCSLKMRFPFVAKLLLILLAPTLRGALLAIDYGAEFTKLSLIKPGVPFDVVLDRDSKRKIQSVVGWKRDDRVFGQEGKMAVGRSHLRKLCNEGIDELSRARDFQMHISPM